MAMTKAERRLEAVQRRERRRAQREDTMEARTNVLLGFGAAWVGEKVAVNMLPSLTPDADSPLNLFGGVVDLGLAVGGGWLAFSDETEWGDYGLGAMLVGSTQFLDRIADAVVSAITRNAA